LFLLWGVLSLSVSTDITTSIKKLISIAIGLMTTYMFYDFLSRDRRSLENVLTMLFWIVTGIAITSMIAAMYAIARGIPIYKQIALWMWTPNSLGYFLFVTSIPLVDSYIRPLQNRQLKFLWIGLVFLGLLISSSRAAWLAAAVSYAYILWPGRLRAAIAVGIIGGLVFVGLGFPIFGEDTANFLLGQQYTGRREIWTAAWKTAWDYPILGTGLGTSWEMISRYIETPYLVGQDTHNVYLKNAVEMGFMSVVFQLSFYAAFIFAARKIERGLSDTALKGVTRGATATILGLMVHGIFENGFVLTAFGAAEFTVMWPYIVIAIPFASERLAENTEQTACAC
jgi:O-antigen ligase